MQKTVKGDDLKNGLTLDNLSSEDRQNLVDVFAWLIQEDKKQNPALYERSKQTIL